MVYPSIRSFVVIQFCVCFCPSTSLNIICICVRPSVCPPVCIFLCDIVVTLLVCMFSFRSFVRPNVRPSSVRMIMHACKSVVYKHVRDIHYF